MTSPVEYSKLAVGATCCGGMKNFQDIPSICGSAKSNAAHAIIDDRRTYSIDRSDRSDRFS